MFSKGLCPKVPSHKLKDIGLSSHLNGLCDWCGKDIGLSKRAPLWQRTCTICQHGCRKIMCCASCGEMARSNVVGECVGMLNLWEASCSGGGKDIRIYSCVEI